MKNGISEPSSAAMRGQGVGGKLGGEERIQPEQDARGVAAAAAEAGAVRDLFRQRDPQPRLEAARGAEEERGADGEVIGIRRQGGIVARQS